MNYLLSAISKLLEAKTISSEKEFIQALATDTNGNGNGNGNGIDKILPPEMITRIKETIIPPVPREKAQDIKLGRVNGNFVLDYTNGQSTINITYKPGNEIYIDYFFLPPERTGKGVTKQMFRKLLPIAKELNIGKIGLRASDVGRYAWSKFGFNSVYESTRQDRWDRVKHLSGDRFKFQSVPHMADVAIARIENIEGYYDWVQEQTLIEEKRFLSRAIQNDTYTCNQEFLLGKYVLLTDSNWDGRLDIHESRDSGIMRGYIGLSEGTENNEDDTRFIKLLSSMGSPTAEAVKF